jgi:hypothetical protein
MNAGFGLRFTFGLAAFAGFALAFAAFFAAGFAFALAGFALAFAFLVAI